ncbi:MAG: glycine cleavage system protein R [Vulcanimicrobiota bacterium]
MKAFVATVVGPDRPGLMDTLSKTIEAAGGNWLESRMTHLGGHFAGIVRVEVADETQLLQTMNNIDGLTVTLHPDRPGLVGSPQELTLELVGQDRPGIVHQITAALARHSINIEDFSSEVESAPMSGEMLFSASITVGLPPACDLEALRAELEKIAEDLMCDFKFDSRAALHA